MIDVPERSASYTAINRFFVIELHDGDMLSVSRTTARFPNSDVLSFQLANLLAAIGESVNSPLPSIVLF